MPSVTFMTRTAHSIVGSACVHAPIPISRRAAAPRRSIRSFR